MTSLPGRVLAALGAWYGRRTPRPQRRPPSLSWVRLRAIAWKEALQLRRDPRTLVMAFVVPAVLVIFFGYVITFDVKDIRVAVLDQDRTQRSREFVTAFQASGWFRVDEHLARYDDAPALLDRGAVRMVLVIPPGFERALAGGQPAPVQALVDGADANTASIALNYARAIVTAFSGRVLLRGARPRTPVVAQARVWYNEALQSSYMIVPGLVAMIMMLIAAQLTALTIAREWERGTMEQLAATPVRRVEVIAGKLVPYLVIGLIDVTAAIVIAILVFGVPFRGNPLLLLGMATLFLLGALGLGICISALAKSQLIATQTAMQATYLPSNLLSGLMFDIASMPVVLQVLSYAVPARYFIVVLRGVFLKGIGIDVLWGQGVAMLLFAAVGLTLAVRSFHKEIA